MVVLSCSGSLMVNTIACIFTNGNSVASVDFKQQTTGVIYDL